MSRISFEVPFSIVCNNQRCRPTKKHIMQIQKYMFNNAILNSQDKIIVDGFEEISKCNLDIEVRHNVIDSLHIAFNLKNLSKQIEHIEEVVNIICAIFPASYYSDEYATFNYMIDDYFESKNCILKITDIPQNIQLV